MPVRSPQDAELSSAVSEGMSAPPRKHGARAGLPWFPQRRQLMCPSLHPITQHRLPRGTADLGRRPGAKLVSGGGRSAPAAVRDHVFTRALRTCS